MRAALFRMVERVFGRGGIVAWHGIGADPLWPAMHATPACLQTQLSFLTAGYTIVSLSELLSRWSDDRPTNGCVALTFDDAYRGVLEHAVPLLIARRLPATIFISSAQAATGAGYWWDLAELYRRRGGRGWAGLLRRVGLPEENEPDRGMTLLRDRVLSRYAGRLPSEADDQEVFADTPWRSLTFSDLEALARHPEFEFACHTVTHPALPFLPAAEREREIREGFDTVRDRLGRALAVLAYPYGLYDRGTAESARRAGMMAAVTMEGRAAGRSPDLFSIPRVGLGSVHDSRSIALRLSNAMRPMLIARNRGAHPRLPVDPPGRLISAEVS